MLQYSTELVQSGASAIALLGSRESADNSGPAVTQHGQHAIASQPHARDRLHRSAEVGAPLDLLFEVTSTLRDTRAPASGTAPPAPPRPDRKQG